MNELFRDARMEHPLSANVRSGLEALDAYLIKHVGLTFGNRVMRQAESFIPAYAACGGGETEAVDVLLRNKILYKMDSLNPAICRAEADGIIKYIQNVFGDGELPLCVSYLKKFGTVI